MALLLPNWLIWGRSADWPQFPDLEEGGVMVPAPEGGLGFEDSGDNVGTVCSSGSKSSTKELLLSGSAVFAVTHRHLRALAHGVVASWSVPHAPCLPFLPSCVLQLQRHTHGTASSNRWVSIPLMCPIILYFHCVSVLTLSTFNEFFYRSLFFSLLRASTTKYSV